MTSLFYFSYQSQEKRAWVGKPDVGRVHATFEGAEGLAEGKISGRDSEFQLQFGGQRRSYTQRYQKW